MSLQYDWSRFSLKIYINTPIQRVYDAWSTRENLEHWFLRKAEFTMPSGELRDKESAVQINDAYKWTWHGYPDTVVEHGTVMEANGTDKFQFVFGNAGIVCFQLTAHAEITEVLLTQEQIPADDNGRSSYHVGCSNGWTFYLANLKSILEGGIDLRNKNPEYTNVINS